MTKEPRFTIRFDDGAYVTPNPLPHARVLRIALRGVGEHGKFDVAEIVDAQGEILETITTIGDQS